MTRFSELEMVGGKLVEKNVRVISQSSIGSCPFVIMVADHYREDGTCKCDDHDEQEMMINEWGYTREDFVKNGL